MSGWSFNLFAPTWSWGGFAWNPKGDDYTSFNAKRGDILSIYMPDFDDKKLRLKANKPRFVTAINNTQLKKYASSQITFIYAKQTGKLYFNGNGSKKGSQRITPLDMKGRKEKESMGAFWLD